MASSQKREIVVLCETNSSRSALSFASPASKVRLGGSCKALQKEEAAESSDIMALVQVAQSAKGDLILAADPDAIGRITRVKWMKTLANVCPDFIRSGRVRSLRAPAELAVDVS